MPLFVPGYVFCVTSPQICHLFVPLCTLQPERNNGTWVITTLNAWHRCGQVEKTTTGYQWLQSKHITVVTSLSNTYRSHAHISVFKSSSCISCSSSCARAFPTVGQTHISPLPLSALCSLAKQREVTVKMARTPGPVARRKQAAPQL